MTQPRWREDDREWKANIQRFMALGDGEWDRVMHEYPVSSRARAVATAVFYTAANHNTIFRAPLPMQIYTWAQAFDCDHRGCRDWLTVDLAERAVNAHFAKSEDGRMVPAHVLREVAILKLESGDE